MIRPNPAYFQSRIDLSLWLAALVVCFWAHDACAVEPEKAAASLARQAVQVEEGGDPARAAELYLEAFRTDATQPNYLYAAARSEMTAGKTASAEEHFEQFLGLADAGTERADKARAYLADLRGSRAESKEMAANRAAAAGHWPEASKLYEELWNRIPTRWSSLFKAGQAAQQAGDNDRAGELLRQYLREAPKSAADRPEAEDCLKRLGSTQAEPDARGQVAPEAGNVSRAVAWTVLGTGVALLAGGAGLLFYGVSEEQALNRDLKLVDGYVTGNVSHAQAQTRADTIALHQSLGLGLTAAGVAAAGVGTWLVLREPERSPRSRLSVVPGPALAGLCLGWRF